MDDTNEIARKAVGLREELLRTVRESAPDTWAQMIRHGARFTMPEAWSVLDPTDQAARLAETELRRVIDGPLYALGHGACRAVIDASCAGLLLAPDILPAPSGSVYFHTPIALPGPDRVGSVMIATWGPPPPAMGLPGLWLTWYADPRESGEAARIGLPPTTGVRIDQEHFLRFFPAIDQRLMPGTAPAEETSRILRTVLLTLLGIRQELLPGRTIQPASAAESGDRSAPPVRVVEIADPAIPRRLAEAAGAHAMKLLA